VDAKTKLMEHGLLSSAERASVARYAGRRSTTADTIADRGARAHLPHLAADDVACSEARRESAILNALPAHIVLLDPDGVIVNVNEAWRQLADSNQLDDRACGIGQDYLAICDNAQGTDAPNAAATAAGIRSVLSGESKRFSIEYFCDTPVGRTWFLLTVAPLEEQRPQGAVVMHVNITDEKRSKQSLLRFAAAMEASVDAISTART